MMTDEKGLSILSFSGTQLAFALSEVVSIRRSRDLEDKCDVALSVGSVVHTERRWPVFHLNASFEPSLDLPCENVYCVCLSADASVTGIALTCDAVNTISLNPGDRIPSPLPICMQRDVTPLKQILLYEDQLLPVSTAPDLATYLRFLME